MIKGFAKRLGALWLSLMLLMTLVPSVPVAAAEDFVFDDSVEADGLVFPEEYNEIESYSLGPIYQFRADKSAEEQLDDLFTTIDLQDASIEEMQKEMEAGNLTSQKLTKMYLDRIKAYDRAKDLNSIIWINESALEDAKKLDEERAQGQVRGKLHGIPIVVKDNYNVAGMPTSAGSVALTDLTVTEDAPTVAKLREAGAVILAKANMSEFAYSAVDSHSTLGGNAHNAYDPTRMPGGSSGGTATAVRSNFAAAGLGTDTGGSIRNPSSYSGLFGIRPSKGLTSIDGVLPLMASRDTTGPMAKSAEDLAIVLESMAGSDPGDDYTLEADADTLKGEGYSTGLSVNSLKGKRIAWLTSSFDYYKMNIEELNRLVEERYGVKDFYKESDIRDSSTLSADMEALSRRVRADLKKAGAEFVDLSGQLSDEDLYLTVYMNDPVGKNGKISMEYDINGFLAKLNGENKIKTVKDVIGTGSGIGYIYDYLGDTFSGEYPFATSFVREDYEQYGYISFGDQGYLRTGDWQEVLTKRNAVSEVLKQNQVDAIMYLHFIDASPKQNEEASIATNPSPYERAFGPVLGFPDINVPMGFLPDSNGVWGEGLPVGMGLVGNFGGEKALMEIAYAYEQEAGDIIRKTPEITPALRDEELNSYLDALMEVACALDPLRYGGAQSSKFRKLYDAYDKALNADYSDPESVYEAAYELAVAYDKIIEAYHEKMAAAGTVLVKGQTLKNISGSIFEGVEGITTYSSEDKKIATVTKKGVITGKKAGKTTIYALDASDKKNVKTLAYATVTVVDRPKLVVTGNWTKDDVDREINGFEFLVSKDYDLLMPDKWISSRGKVAVIDSASGKMIVKGKGTTRITACFGNVKVSTTLRVK